MGPGNILGVPPQIDMVLEGLVTFLIFSFVNVPQKGWENCRIATGQI
jgi:hypothetical protein